MPRSRAAPLQPGIAEAAATGSAALSIGLSAVIVAASDQDPRVLTIRLPGVAREAAEALPAGPLEPEHRTLEIGLRTWVERQTSQRLGYVEQLYTFGDRDRIAGEAALALPALVVAYLALVREVRPAGAAEAEWHSWYRYFPWEDWRQGRSPLLAPLEAGLGSWAATAGSDAERRLREERLGLAFGLSGATWNEELVLERYELLYEAGLVAEAARDLGVAEPAVGDAVRDVAGDDVDAAAADGAPDGAQGVAMALDHRRILATA